MEVRLLKAGGITLPAAIRRELGLKAGGESLFAKFGEKGRLPWR
jgi:bifunctional DNA-binding transcriptional regulator/antitoxin component of YhaV-PrlF toxin-antitoxin module